MRHWFGRAALFALAVGCGIVVSPQPARAGCLAPTNELEAAAVVPTSDGFVAAWSVLLLKEDGDHRQVSTQLLDVEGQPIGEVFTREVKADTRVSFIGLHTGRDEAASAEARIAVVGSRGTTRVPQVVSLAVGPALSGAPLLDTDIRSDVAGAAVSFARTRTGGLFVFGFAPLVDHGAPPSTERTVQLVAVGPAGIVARTAHPALDHSGYHAGATAVRWGDGVAILLMGASDTVDIRLASEDGAAATRPLASWSAPSDDGRWVRGMDFGGDLLVANGGPKLELRMIKPSGEVERLPEVDAPTTTGGYSSAKPAVLEAELRRDGSDGAVLESVSRPDRQQERWRARLSSTGALVGSVERREHDVPMACGHGRCLAVVHEERSADIVLRVLDKDSSRIGAHVLQRMPSPRSMGPCDDDQGWSGCTIGRARSAGDACTWLFSAAGLALLAACACRRRRDD